MDREETGGFQGGREWRAGTGRYKLVHTKWVNKNLLYNTGTTLNILGQAIMGRNIYTCSTSQHPSRSASVATEAHLPGPCLSTTIHKPRSLSSQLLQSLEENIYYRRDPAHVDKVSREGTRPQRVTGTFLT